MSDHIRRVVYGFREAFFIQHDANAAAQMYTDDATLWDPFTPVPIKGREAIQENLEMYLQAFPDISIEATNLFSSGGFSPENWFAAEFTLRGTNTGLLKIGPGRAISPTGKRIALKVCWIGRVTPKGLCAEDRSYYDSASLMNQLGLAPPR